MPKNIDMPSLEAALRITESVIKPNLMLQEETIKASITYANVTGCPLVLTIFTIDFKSSHKTTITAIMLQNIILTTIL
jgi:hypothetical protein